MNPENRRLILHIVLFVATFGMATAANGAAYAASILSILLAHEMGHYWMCKRYGIAATFPAFIPFPNIFGTMGAVIGIKSPFPNRRALFDVGVTGPLVGLAVSLPFILLGLRLSTVGPIPKDGLEHIFGEPLLFKWLSDWIMGPLAPGQIKIIHPIAFAGWAALFVTSLNLFPVGQLDGGHMMYAMLGKQARKVSWGVLGLLVYLGYAYQSMWWFFAGIIVLFLLRHPSPLDDHEKLDTKRWIIGLATFALMVLSFTPVPFELRVIP